MLPPEHWPECQTCGEPVDMTNCVQVSAVRILGGTPAPIGTLVHHIDCFMQEGKEREQAKKDRQKNGE